MIITTLQTVPTKMARTLGLVICVLGFLSACAPITRDHGYVPLEEDLSGLVVGLDTRDSVLERLGTPALTALRMDNRLYFIESTVSRKGMSRPKVTRREVLALSFDPNGVLRNIERFDLSDGRVVTLERRVTDSIEDHGGFFSSIFKSIGQVSAGRLGL